MSLMKTLYRIGFRDHPLVNLIAVEAGGTALHHAVSRGDLRAVEILLNAGANPLIQTDLGMNALDMCEFPAIRNVFKKNMMGMFRKR